MGRPAGSAGDESISVSLGEALHGAHQALPFLHQLLAAILDRSLLGYRIFTDCKKPNRKTQQCGEDYHIDS
eukprot:CAMPEP_0181460836 /NCGR_PEP_ID=MMETSP1110-20121109/33554_1 /TAXON_ID=174948 /ORGANISM="Symbiodinium sp., Strain CCMP421" /LENGTH=70 /DNA_ID=CAMNT_0023585415 /DNA_START=176 /DNA_END=388 /DNA_ORIENTATION=+